MDGGQFDPFVHFSRVNDDTLAAHEVCLQRVGSSRLVGARLGLLLSTALATEP